MFEAWLDALQHALGKRRVLLCLDEFEQLQAQIDGGRPDRRILGLLRSVPDPARGLVRDRAREPGLGVPSALIDDGALAAAVLTLQRRLTVARAMGASCSRCMHCSPSTHEAVRALILQPVARAR